MSVNLNAIIVEDDPYFVKYLVLMLNKYEFLNITNIFVNGESFLKALNQGLVCDIVFLDIDLPGITGFQIGNRIKNICTDTKIVFVTGHAEYAVNAFDLDAIDYLLKPFDQERLRRCLERVKASYIIKTINQKTDSIPIYKIIENGNIIILKTKDIIFIEKLKKQVVFHTLLGIYKRYGIIETLEKELLPQGFLRSHKSYIVNPKYIKKIEKWGDRAYQIKFDNTKNTALLSRSKVQLLRDTIL